LNKPFASAPVKAVRTPFNSTVSRERGTKP
jgi:hypothetical protein